MKLESIPARVERDRSRFPETFAIFEKALGRVFEIRGFGQHGHAEIWLYRDGSEDRTGGADLIWVEPAHLSPA